MNPPEMPNSLPAPISEEEGLRCMHCSYDLTGLTVSRCPECGEAFDLQLLRDWTMLQPSLATPWETERGVKGFLRTWAMSLFLAPRLAASFPARHNRYRAIGYLLLCHLAVGLVLCWPILLLNLPNNQDFLTIALLAWVCSFIGCTVTEVMLGLLLGWLAPVAGTERHQRHFWCGLMHYLRGFAVLSAVVGGLWIGALLDQLGHTRQGTRMEVPVLPAAGVLLWWMVMVWAMIMTRSLPVFSRLVACCAVPVVAAAGIAVGYFSGVLVALVYLS